MEDLTDFRIDLTATLLANKLIPWGESFELNKPLQDKILERFSKEELEAHRARHEQIEQSLPADNPNILLDADFFHYWPELKKMPLVEEAIKESQRVAKERSTSVIELRFESARRRR